jgi:hypothetical protein
MRDGHTKTSHCTRFAAYSAPRPYVSSSISSLHSPCSLLYISPDGYKYSVCRHEVSSGSESNHIKPALRNGSRIARKFNVRGDLSTPTFCDDAWYSPNIGSDMNASSLLRLPVELHLQIIDHLELQSMIILAAVNRYFRSIIEPLSHDEFLAAEATSWAVKKKLYICKGCTRFRYIGEFPDDMKKGKRTRSGAKAHDRFCLDCGVKTALYTPGSHTIIFGKPHVL